MKKITLFFLALSTALYSQEATSLRITDTRRNNDLPSAFSQVFKVDFKTRQTVGVPGAGTHSGLITIAPWGDNTGNKNHQLNFNDGGVFYRNGAHSDPQWSSWREIVMKESNGTTNLQSANFQNLIRVNYNAPTYGIAINSATGSGWARGYYFSTNDGTANQGGFGAYGGSNTLINYFIGTYDNPIAKFYPTDKKTIYYGNISVQAKLEAKEIKVTTTPTADFVFEDNYDLPKLEEVEKFIIENKHLPEIASAKEMEKNGVNIGEFQIKLLQKIEELTLYSIEQNKKIKRLEKENNQLKLIMEKLEKLEKNVIQLSR
ncbi:MAG: cell wall anchor protein [Cruoricaptor ignavus]|nr:cell wall anchor protein [Cruoricaptor ignavus]